MKEFINTLMHRLSSMFKNGGKNWSSVRFGFILCVIISNLCFWGVWTVLCIYDNTIQPIPESVIVLYSLANGISFAGKIFQKNTENKK